MTVDLSHWVENKWAKDISSCSILFVGPEVNVNVWIKQNDVK